MGPRTILFVEDDAAGRELGCFNLRKAGYAVEAAADGREAMQTFTPERHALVITDLRMPRASGLDVLRHVKQRSPETPVIVITAHGDAALTRELTEAGADSVVAKPFDREQLVRVIREVQEETAGPQRA